MNTDSTTDEITDETIDETTDDTETNEDLNDVDPPRPQYRPRWLNRFAEGRPLTDSMMREAMQCHFERLTATLEIFTEATSPGIGHSFSHDWFYHWAQGVCDLAHEAWGVLDRWHKETAEPRFMADVVAARQAREAARTRPMTPEQAQERLEAFEKIVAPLRAAAMANPDIAL